MTTKRSRSRDSATTPPRPAVRSRLAIGQIFDGMVAKAFCAQLRTDNRRTGQRHVALDVFPETETAAINSILPPPELPTLCDARQTLEHHPKPS